MDNPQDPLKHVALYTDGACSGNPGPGGFATLLVFGAKRKEIFAGFRRTTNNRMELMAVIAGLRELRYRCRVTVYTDSRYVAEGITKGWAERWRRNGWRRNKTEMATNVDLWSELLDLCAGHEIAFEWVRGHAGHAENERCDALAVQASRQADLPPDTGYESGGATAAGSAMAR